MATQAGQDFGGDREGEQPFFLYAMLAARLKQQALDRFCY